MNTKQTITIRHDRAERGPLCIDHVPPLAADGMNADSSNERWRIVCIDGLGRFPVIAYDCSGNCYRFTRTGRIDDDRDPRCGAVPSDIIALDGQPAEPALVRVDSLKVGERFLYDDCTYIRTDSIGPEKDDWRNLNEETGYFARFNGAVLVGTLAPSEKLVITVTAEGERKDCATTCQAAKKDGVVCADGECDRENGVRP